jgi:hypothetical protein
MCCMQWQCIVNVFIVDLSAIIECEFVNEVRKIASKSTFGHRRYFGGGGCKGGKCSSSIFAT